MNRELLPTPVFLKASIDNKILFLKDKSNRTTSFTTKAIALIMLGRPRTCIPGYITFMLGICYNEVEFSWKIILGAFLSFLIGFSANLHNAYTDIEEDVNNLPGRIFILAKYGYKNLFRTLVIMDIAMFLLSFFLGWCFVVFMVLAILGLQQYSFPPYRTKNKPLIGLWVFAQAVVFPFVFGWAIKPEPLNAVVFPAILFGEHVLEWNQLIPRAFTDRFDPVAITGRKYLGMYFFLTLWFMAKGLYKNVPDYIGDKMAGVRSSATIFHNQRNAALFASAATIFVYMMLPFFIWQGALLPRAGFALIWIIPVLVSCRNLANATTQMEGNRCLKYDMLISIGFISTILLLQFPQLFNFVYFAIGIIILVASDILNVDSRRAKDVIA